MKHKQILPAEMSMIYQTIHTVLKLDVAKKSNFKSAMEQYWKVITKRCETRGITDTISFSKQFYNLAVKLAVGSKFEALSMTKSDKSGFPTSFDKVKPFLVGNGEDKRVGLTIAKLYTSLLAPIDYSTESITKPYSGYQGLGSKWINFLTDFSRDFRESVTPRCLSWEHNWRQSSKVGPNGPTLPTSVLDMVSVRNDPRVWQNLKEYLILTDSDLLEEIETLAIDKRAELVTVPVKHSKLAFLQEGGGKTRVIAIGDYLSQQALTPIFKLTMKFLKTLPTDGTYNQNHAVLLVKQAMKLGKPIHCLDLKSATDRFPLKYQVDLLASIFGQAVGNAWGKLLTDRSFYSQGKYVEYAVGQPMGFLSSWSTFALTHHALIQYSARRVGITSFSDYVVLGDDVAIFNTKVAVRYTKLLTQIGVEISLQKSMVWLPGFRQYPSAEFAKRIIWNEIDISPLPFDLLKTYIKDPVKEYFTLRFSLESFGIDLDESSVALLSDSLLLNKVQKKQISILSSAPSTLMGKTKREQPYLLSDEEGVGPWKGLDINLIPSVLMETLWIEFQDKLKDIEKIALTLNHYNKVVEEISSIQGGTKLKAPLLRAISMIPILRNDPLVMVIHKKRADLVLLSLRGMNVSNSIDWQFPEVSGLWGRVLHVTEDLFSVFTDRKSRLSQVQSIFTLKIFKRLSKGYRPLLQARMESSLDDPEETYEDIQRKYFLSRAFLGPSREG